MEEESSVRPQQACSDFCKQTEIEAVILASTAVKVSIATICDHPLGHATLRWSVEIAVVQTFHVQLMVIHYVQSWLFKKRNYSKSFILDAYTDIYRVKQHSNSQFCSILTTYSHLL